LKHQIKASLQFNLLHSDVYQKLSARPSLIREAIAQKKHSLIVIDEIQKLPALMDEVHSIIEDHGTKFILTGSSLRKLKKTYTSLMAGRAKTVHLHPFVSIELSNKFKLQKALSVGTLPPVYLSDDPLDELKSYVGDYLKEEIQAEALARNIHNFSRFLNVAATTNGQLINFEAIGNDAQVPSRTVREYFSLLEDTLMGNIIAPFRHPSGRKPVSHGKFYFFDIGVVHSLLHRSDVKMGTREYGEALEHFIYLELKAYLDYKNRSEEIQFWRTHTGLEVDFVIEDQLALEVKSSKLVTHRDLKGLKALFEEKKFKQLIAVSNDTHARKIGPITILPVQEFLQSLWAGDIL